MELVSYRDTAFVDAQFQVGRTVEDRQIGGVEPAAAAVLVGWAVVLARLLRTGRCLAQAIEGLVGRQRKSRVLGQDASDDRRAGLWIFERF